MKRDVYKDLIYWKSSKRRKPLILKGARQVGKTYILKAFGNTEYKNTAYFNFEEDPALNNFFEGKLDPQKILEKLSIYQEKKITKQDTLIIFDEIQSSPNALNSLKYFQEKENDYHLVAAGSLLGIKIGRTAPFPVGKVNFLNLYPISFGEFLDSIDKSLLRNALSEKTSFSKIDDTFHNELNDIFKLYTYIGGMPEVVSIYNETKDLSEVRQTQKEILSSFEMDFSKYASATEGIRIQAVWDTIPSQLTRENKKFKYSEIDKNARSRDYYNSIQWLIDAGFVYQSYNIKVPKLPLSAYKDDGVFKLFLFDVGLLCAKLNISQKMILKGDSLFSEFNGAMTENIVSQEIIPSQESHLYYWSNKNSAEVDFIVMNDNKIYPLEVKSGNSKRKTSLNVYSDKFKPPALIRSSPRNFKRDGILFNIPLYAISNYRNFKLD